MEAYKCPLFREGVEQIKLRIPKGGQRLTLNNVSFIHVAFYSRLKFKTQDDGSKDYGHLDERVYTQGAGRLPHTCTQTIISDCAASDCGPALNSRASAHIASKLTYHPFKPRTTT